jgi:hypothetical protein
MIHSRSAPLRLGSSKESAMSTAAVCTSSSFAPSLPLPARAAAVPPAVRRGAWQIGPGEALSLKASRTSVLRVRQGRVWITHDATAQHPSEDLVLAPGESLVVAAGRRIVMEPWDGYGATYSWDVVTTVATVGTERDAA